MKRKKSLIIAIGCLVLMGSSELAVSSIAINTVDDAIRVGLTHSPFIKGQSYKLNAAKELPNKLGSLEDPRVGVRLNGTPAKNPAYDFDQKRYFIGQAFPFLGEVGRKKVLGEKKSRLR